MKALEKQKNITEYNLPYGLDPPEEFIPEKGGLKIVFQIMIALMIAVLLMFTLMRLKAETFLRLWFLIVVIIGIAIALNAFIIGIKYSAIIALIVAIPTGIVKIYTKHQTRNYLISPVSIAIERSGYLQEICLEKILDKERNS